MTEVGTSLARRYHRFSARRPTESRKRSPPSDPSGHEAEGARCTALFGSDKDPIPAAFYAEAEGGPRSIGNVRSVTGHASPSGPL